MVMTRSTLYERAFSPSTHKLSAGLLLHSATAGLWCLLSHAKGDDSRVPREIGGLASRLSPFAFRPILSSHEREAIIVCARDWCSRPECELG